MALLLSPEVQERIERRLQDGRWQSPSQIVDKALDLLDDLDDLIVLSREDLDEKLEVSIAQADRGETYSMEEVKEHMAKLFASPE